MSSGLPNRPSFPSQDRIDRFKTSQLGNSHLFPYGPKPKGKRAYTAPANLPFPRIHSKEGHAWRSAQRKPLLDRIRQQRAEDEKKCEYESIHGKKPTLADRLAALPPPTYTPIASKPVTLNFEKLTVADLIRIFSPKFEATLKRLEVFETFTISDDVPHRNVGDLRALIDRLQHLKRALRDTSSIRIKEEFQQWNWGLHNIGQISFKSLRKNQAQIIKELSSVWQKGFFGYE